ncbi:uncharacterized protein BYT42DRAFT_240578 [Radiomyces spectabilis]|uniref:uncharacterized protein n=1 Tax=Radiomyces spectabilis TaxID=64574 RepID=UPI00221FE3B2|nr:uncharacterized protein BYT42DRAFT_240578 [Radiomyces spectabilis]KAI8388594.1 hypothetical protein BYT42DRAFT_240578 [Radiomyces spectabilis]
MEILKCEKNADVKYKLYESKETAEFRKHPAHHRWDEQKDNGIREHSNTYYSICTEPFTKNRVFSSRTNFVLVFQSLNLLMKKSSANNSHTLPCRLFFLIRQVDYEMKGFCSNF